MGEAIGAVISKYPTGPAVAHLRVDAQGFGWMPQEDFVKHFAADVDRVKANVMFAVQQPLPASAFEEAMGKPAWRAFPSWYLVPKNDQVIPPDLERFFAKRMQATTVEIDSSLVAMVSHPDHVTDLIVRAAESVAEMML